MKREYVKPEFQVREVNVFDDVLSTSSPELTIPETGATLPRNDDDW